MASWLSSGGGLLRSLENVLEKVDNAAGSTLKKDGSKDFTHSPVSLGSSSRSSLYSAASASPISKTINDEDLFEFLNAPIKEAKEKREGNRVVKKPAPQIKKISPTPQPTAPPVAPSDNGPTMRNSPSRDSLVSPYIAADATIEQPPSPRTNSIVTTTSSEPATAPAKVSPSVSLQSEVSEPQLQPAENLTLSETASLQADPVEQQPSIDQTSTTDNELQEEPAIAETPVVFAEEREREQPPPTSPNRTPTKETNTTTPFVSEEEYDTLLNQNSDLQLENKLLRSKVVSLNQELTSLTTRIKTTQLETERIATTMQETQKAMHEKDKQMGKMRRIEEEFDATLTHKNSQITSLQVKLEEAFQDLKARDEKIANFQRRIDAMNNDKESTVEANLQSFSLLKEKIEEFEKKLSEEQQQHAFLKKHAVEREAELEANIAELTKAVATTQRALEEKSNEAMRTTAQLKELQDVNRTFKQDLADYKVRATKVLQEKEKVIKDLSEQISSGQPQQPESVGLAEHIRLQQERDALKRERDENKEAAEELRGTLDEVQAQFEADREAMENQIKDLEETLEKEKKKVQALHMQSVAQSQEIASLREDNERQSSSVSSSLKSKEDEITKLKRQIAAKSINSSSQEELENRLQTITEHLIQKQTALETALSEKAYLQLQLENTIQANNERKNSMDEDEKNHSILIDDNSGFTRKRRNYEDSGPRQRSIASLVENSSMTSEDSAIRRRVVGAAHFLDSVSTVTGLSYYNILLLEYRLNSRVKLTCLTTV
eukprot:TRINITY_DN3491_c0_g1_i3.p1 TRINITY_DN3491_c0_g1~~TRINITY_DN3491_c0_g1_i3.p1  ORF type:complete len:777 (-),score=222.94 TRINITY_DN3491_c0_g1_i3:38-2368(-)